MYLHNAKGHATDTDLLEVPTIDKAYLGSKFQGICPQNLALYGVVPPFKGPAISIDGMKNHNPLIMVYIQTYSHDIFIIDPTTVDIHVTVC